MAWSTDCEEWWSLGNRSEGSPASGTMSQYYNQTSQMAPWTFPTFYGTGRKIRWVVELTRVTSCRLRKTRIWTGSGTGLVRAVPLGPRALLECSGWCRTACALLGGRREPPQVFPIQYTLFSRIYNTTYTHTLPEVSHCAVGSNAKFIASFNKNEEIKIKRKKIPKISICTWNIGIPT